MVVRKLAKSWQYDFTLQGHGRQRRAGFRTKAEALEAERRAREDLISGRRRTLVHEAYRQYLAATRLKARTQDAYAHYWERIEPALGHLYIEEVTTSAMDALKSALPTHLGPKSINNHLTLIRAVLRFMWKRGQLPSVPYVPMESVPKTKPNWYSEEERDRLLDGMFRLQPQWYLFFYVTARLGLRLAEVYALSRSRVRDIPPQLTIDRAVQRGTRERPAVLVTRKNDETLVLDLTQDIVAAIRWHVQEDYAGPEFMFSPNGQFPVYLDSHKRPLLAVQRALGLRPLGHHAIGRHSVASQAATGGQSIKAIQAQLGHRSEQSTHVYAHLGSRAQLRLVEALQPVSPPHVNVRSTSKKKGT